MVRPQLAKRDLGDVCGGRDDVADLDLLMGNDHPIDQELDEGTFLLERGVR